MKTLELLLARHKIKQPDYIIPGFWFDDRARKEQGIRLPIREIKANNYNLHGCYLWFQPGDSGGQVEVMYAGKATRLCNRLQQHWNNKTEPKFLEQWYQWTEENNEPFVPCVAVWLCSDFTEFELKLIRLLKPRYNVASKNSQPKPKRKMLAGSSQIQQLRLFEREIGYLI